jgi:hypothetical protein
LIAGFKSFNKNYRLLAFFFALLLDFLVFLAFLESEEFDRDACAAATIAIGILWGDALT